MAEADETEELKRSYQELLRKYDNVVSHNVAGMYRTTMDGRILECNDALAQMLGYSSGEEVKQQKALQLYGSKSERQRFISDLKKKGKLINYEIRLQHVSGRQIDALENVHLDHSNDGESTIQGTIIDVSAFRQAEFEQRALMHSYQSLVDHIHDGLLVVQNGKIVFANPAADRLLGTATIGRHVAQLFSQEDADHICSMADVQENEEVPGPRILQIREKELTLYTVPFLNEGLPAVQCTLQDHAAQQALLQQQMRVRMVEEVNQVLRDEIDRHRATQEELSRSRHFARSLIDSSLDMILAADPEGRIAECNPAATLRFGWEPEEILGKDSSILYADAEEFTRIQQQLDSDGTFSGEVKNVARNGEIFTSFLAASRLFDQAGTPMGAMGVSRDITKLKRDQQALQASEERYRDLFENATDLIQSIDLDGRFEYVNTAWLNTLGYSEEELKELNIVDILDPKTQTEFIKKFELGAYTTAEGIFSTVFIGKQGQQVIVEGTTNVRYSDGAPVGMRSILRDVTKVQAANRQVQEHEAKLRALFESSDHMFWTVCPDIKITSFNRAYSAMIVRLHGVEPEINKDPARPRKTFAAIAYHDFWSAKYAIAFQGEPTRFQTEVVDHQGQRVCNEIFLSPVFSADGSVQEVFGVGHEITEQKEAEDKVREQAARLQALFDSSANTMIWTMDRDFRLTSCNTYFRTTMHQVVGADLDVGDEFLTEDTRKSADVRFERIVEYYRAGFKGKPQQFETELLDRAGQEFWVEVFVNPITVNGVVQEISCLSYNITDRKEAQTILLKNLREKEVLLKEVHHRVKNNLQIVSSIFNLQTAHVGEDQRILDLLRDSRDRIRSMSFIHESLYQNEDLSSVDLADYMEGLSRNLMMSYSLTGKVRLETDLQRVDLALDQAIPCGLILNELISNALKHAFPEGREGSIHLGLQLDGSTVTITLRDDGTGTPEGFDPQRDANLGLELVHTLVEQLDGQLNMENDGGVSYLFTFERIK